MIMGHGAEHQLVDLTDQDLVFTAIGAYFLKNGAAWLASN